jgi:hypothetical protein
MIREHGIIYFAPKNPLVTAVARANGANFQDNMWTWILNWFYNDNTAVKLPNDQVWFID